MADSDTSSAFRSLFWTPKRSTFKAFLRFLRKSLFPTVADVYLDIRRAPNMS